MPFLTEAEPARGTVLPVAPGIGRIVARNPGSMTYWGTNTYLIESDGGTLVIDPGPDDAAHVADVLAAAPRIRAILLSHTHHDHLGATAALHAASGAPVHAWHESAVPGFSPDVPLRDGDAVAGWSVVHTPGHAADHVCFAGPGGVLFSADHVMSWSSSIVSPPDGNMADYFRSLERLLQRDDALFLPGHGPPLPEPRRFTLDLLAHRRAREAAILDALTATPRSATMLTEAVYAAVDPALKRAAERNVIAHLQKLAGEGRANDAAGGWTRA